MVDVHLCDWCWWQRSFIWISIIFLALTTQRTCIGCCLLWSMTLDESDKATVPLHANASCRASVWGVMGRLCQRIYLLKSSSAAVTRAQTATEILLRYRREMSVIECPPPLTYTHTKKTPHSPIHPQFCSGRMGCLNKNGNSSEYIKCGLWSVYRTGTNCSSRSFKAGNQQ